MKYFNMEGSPFVEDTGGEHEKEKDEAEEKEEENKGNF